jgi:hypothetical protein
MRFFEQQHEVGTTRIRSWFAWWPVTCEGETRWMERVTVEQVYAGTSMMGEDPGAPFSWMNKRFSTANKDNLQ